MKNDLNFKYYFTIVGSLSKQSMVLEKIFSDMGVFDTKFINTSNHSSFKNFISFCVNDRKYNGLSESEIDDLLQKTIERFAVSSNWSIIPPTNLCNDLSITYFVFRNEQDMKKYFVYQLLGEDYNILE